MHVGILPGGEQGPGTLHSQIPQISRLFKKWDTN